MRKKGAKRGGAELKRPGAARDHYHGRVHERCDSVPSALLLPRARELNLGHRSLLPRADEPSARR